VGTNIAPRLLAGAVSLPIPTYREDDIMTLRRHDLPLTPALSVAALLMALASPGWAGMMTTASVSGALPVADTLAQADTPDCKKDPTDPRCKAKK
jgi:hypothetical protein